MESDSMSASSKFDLSSGSPDRPLYAPGHHGSYGAASMDRSCNFRENMESPLFSSLPNMTRSHSSATTGDVLNFLSCVRVDPKSMAVEHKLNRPAEFERLANAAFGMPPEDSLPTSSKSKHLTAPSLDDIRRLKFGVLKSGTKARERMKNFNDCLSVINKLFPTIPLRKRSRLDALSNDRSNTLLSADRSASGVGIGKMGLQNHASASDFELAQQKSEERTKNSIPSKRTRTSMAYARLDARASNPARLPGTVDKDRDVVRNSGSNSVQGEDLTLLIATDGWDNSKMKKKRTGIKHDKAASSIMTKVVDGYRELKQGTHQHLLHESRSRLADAYGFRSGSTNGGMGLGKDESTSQTSSCMRSSMSRTDSDSSSVLHERRERLNGRVKGRVNLNSLNKANSRDDISCSSPTSGSKLNLNANIRAPRSGSVGGVSKLSQAVQGSLFSYDWDLSNCTNKINGGTGANSRKRTPSARSSSPVVNWVQRPQKISRTARRNNLLPIITGNDDGPSMDVASDMMVNDKRFPAHSPRQAKIKGDSIYPSALSENEGSCAGEIKSRDKNKKCDKIDEKSVQNVQKMSALLLPPWKNKAVSGEDQGDGVRRQGRTGRGFTSSRSLLPFSVGKHGTLGTAKQIRSSRLGLDNTERAGKPPTRKLPDRKAYPRQKHITISTGADFLDGSDDGHQELLAAANAVTNNAQALSSPFWKKMEPLFQFITDFDISYLKEQVNSALAVDTSAPVPLDTASCTLARDCESTEIGKDEIEARSLELSPENMAPGVKKPNEVSLYQRLIAALIPEEEEGLKYDVHESPFEIEKDMGSDTFCSHSSPSCDRSKFPTSNGYDETLTERLFHELEHNIMLIPGIGFSRFDNLQNSLYTDQSISNTICSDDQYHNMSIDERSIVEVHCLGIYPDLVSGDEELNGDITRLDEKYQEQVTQKKSLLRKLLCSASDAKKLQQEEFEGHALDNLVGMAYEKYMYLWGPNAHGMKSASGKMAKKAALAFVKRTMERYQEFEETGKSCFDDPLYKDIFLSGVSHLIDGQYLNSNTDNESHKLRLGASGCSVEVRTSAPLGTQQSPSSNSQDIYSSEVSLSNNLGSEQGTGKDDSWSNRVKRREVTLDNVGGIVSMGLGGSLSCSAKGKRSELDREGKGNNREAFSRSGTTKISHIISTSVKGDRKSGKAKQKITHLSASVNGSLENIGEQAKGMFASTHKSRGISRSNSGKDNDDYAIEMLEEPIDLSGLQLPDMDDIGAPHDLGVHGEDLGSWLMKFEDDSLHDNDCMGGLGIPMDDLTELNMMV